MTRPMSTSERIQCLCVVGLIGLLLSVSTTEAKSSSPSGDKTLGQATCDFRAHPTITKITPKHAKPGQKITISGKNFGTKHCFHSVSFGPKSTDAWTYVNPTTVEATVPNLKPGTFPIIVSTEGGESQDTLEVQAK